MFDSCGNPVKTKWSLEMKYSEDSRDLQDCFLNVHRSLMM
jgi:hypothetical protein